MVAVEAMQGSRASNQHVWVTRLANFKQTVLRDWLELSEQIFSGKSSVSSDSLEPRENLLVVVETYSRLQKRSTGMRRDPSDPCGTHAYQLQIDHSQRLIRVE